VFVPRSEWVSAEGAVVVVSVILAVAASAANATASVLQRKGARREPDGRSPSVRLLWELVRQPVWVGGVSVVLAGFLLQVAALATGPIALVQPVLIIELPLTLLLSGVVLRARLHAREWVAVAGMSGGVALLLAVLDPAGGDARHAPLFGWIVGSVLMVATVVVLTVFGYRAGQERRAGFLGIATGIAFGYTAVLVAGVAGTFADGIAAVFTAWQTYAVLLVGPVGFVLLQNALRSGRLVASQPGMTLSNPLIGIAWGVIVFGEHIRGGGWIAADVVSAAVIAGSTVLLTRSPVLQDRSA
jgi:drug/metabolite transporter (DMT)-like permease